MKGSTKQKFPNSKMAGQALAKGELESAYLFLGEEEGEKERFIGIIADRYFDKNVQGSARLISKYFAQNGEVTAAAGFALSSSMFDPKKICVLSDIEKIILKTEQQLVADMIRDLPDSTTLILCSSENNPPKFINDELLSLIQPIVFWRLFESELQAHIQQLFQKSGRKIEQSAVNRIVSLTGRDLKKVNAAVDRILVGTAGETVTDRMVVSLIADEKEISIFELIDSILKRKKESFRLLKKVLDEGSADLQIIALLEREAKRIEQYHDLRARGNSHEKALEEIHVNPKALDDFSIYLKMFPEREVKRLFILLSRADYMAKSSSGSSSLLATPIGDLLSAIV